MDIVYKASDPLDEFYRICDEQGEERRLEARRKLYEEKDFNCVYCLYHEKYSGCMYREPCVTLSGVRGKLRCDHSFISSGRTSANILFIPYPLLYLYYIRNRRNIVICDSFQGIKNRQPHIRLPAIV